MCIRRTLNVDCALQVELDLLIEELKISNYDLIFEDWPTPSLLSPPIEMLSLTETSPEPNESLGHRETRVILTQFASQKQERSLHKGTHVPCGRISDSGVLPTRRRLGTAPVQSGW